MDFPVFVYIFKFCVQKVCKGQFYAYEQHQLYSLIHLPTLPSFLSFSASLNGALALTKVPSRLHDPSCCYSYRASILLCYLHTERHPEHCQEQTRHQELNWREKYNSYFLLRHIHLQ